MTKFAAALLKVQDMPWGNTWYAVSSAFYTAYANGCNGDYHQNFAVDNGVIFG